MGLKLAWSILLVCALAAQASDTHSVACRELARLAANHSDYRTSRGVYAFVMKFGRRWERTLATFGNDSLILDGGAGRALTGSQYLGDFPNGGRYLALSLEAPDAATYAERKARFGARYEHLHGQPVEKRDPKSLGAPDAVLDYFGAMSYSAHPEEVLARYLSIARDDTSISLLVGAGIFESAVSYVGNVPLQKWLATIENLIVVPVGHGPETFILRIKDPTKPVRLPKLRLARVTGTDLPPARHFVAENEMLEIAPKLRRVAPVDDARNLLARARATPPGELPSLVLSSLAAVGGVGQAELLELLRLPLSRAMRRLVVQSYFATARDVTGAELRGMQTALRQEQPGTAEWIAFYGAVNLRDRNPAQLAAFTAKPNPDLIWLHSRSKFLAAPEKHRPDFFTAIINRVRGPSATLARHVPKDAHLVEDMRDLEHVLPHLHGLTVDKLLEATHDLPLLDRSALVLQAIRYLPTLDEATIDRLSRQTLLPRQLIQSLARPESRR